MSNIEQRVSRLLQDSVKITATEAVYPLRSVFLGCLELDEVEMVNSADVTTEAFLVARD